MLQNKEITSLIINSIFVKMLLTFPRIVITNSGNAAWLQIILNVLAVLLIYFITILVYKEKKNVIELADEKYGKWLKIPTGIIITLILFTNFLAVIKIFPETIRIVLLKKTPANLIVLLLAAAVFIGAYVLHPKFPLAGVVFTKNIETVRAALNVNTKAAHGTARALCCGGVQLPVFVHCDFAIFGGNRYVQIKGKA